MKALADQVQRAVAYLRQRGDDALGLAPRALMTARAADAWACFWSACRRVDDAADRHDRIPIHWSQALAQDDHAAQALEAFGRLAPTVAASIEGSFDDAWRAMRRRATWKSPPLGADYERTNQTLAGLPMRVLFALMAPRARPPPKVAEAVGLSIQMGDDLRDTAEDLARGLVTITREEVHDEAVHLMTARRRAVRVAACAHVLLEARRLLPRTPAGRRLEAPLGLWANALASGQVRPTRAKLNVAPADAEAWRRVEAMARPPAWWA